MAVSPSVCLSQAGRPIVWKRQNGSSSFWQRGYSRFILYIVSEGNSGISKNKGHWLTDRLLVNKHRHRIPARHTAKSTSYGVAMRHRSISLHIIYFDNLYSPTSGSYVQLNKINKYCIRRVAVYLETHCNICSKRAFTTGKTTPFKLSLLLGSCLKPARSSRHIWLTVPDLIQIGSLLAALLRYCCPVEYLQYRHFEPIIKLKKRWLN